MESSVIIKFNIIIYISDYLTNGLIFIQINSFAFCASPEAFNTDIICGSALAIHRYCELLSVFCFAVINSCI